MYVLALFCAVLVFGNCVDAQMQQAPLGSCTTVGCVRAADFILEVANLSANPCDDFYEFACGTFKSNSNPVKTCTKPESALINDQINKATMKVLAGETSEVTDAETKAIKYYKSCTSSANSQFDDETSTAFLKEYLGKELRGFSFTKAEEENSETWVLEAALAGTILQNGTALFRMSVLPDIANSSRYSILFLPETTPMFQYKQNVDNAIDDDPSYLDEVKEAYVKYLNGLAEQLLDTDDYNSIRDKYLRDVVDFDLELAKITPVPFSSSGIVLNDDVDMENFTTTDENKLSVSVSDLQSISPAINWTFFMKELGKFYNVSALQNPETVKLSYIGASYFHALSHLINNTIQIKGKQLARRTFHNYFTLKAVLSYVESLSCGYSVPFMKMRSRAMGRNAVDTIDNCIKNEARQLSCYYQVKKLFPDILAREFLRTYYNESITDFLQSIGESLLTAYGDTISAVDWLDTFTKAKALRKLKNIKFSYGHPPNLFDQSYDDQYDLLTIEDSFLANLENVNHFQKTRELKKLDSDVDRVKEFWSGIDPNQINAGFKLTQNIIGIFAGQLMYPLFRVDYPPAVNWGRTVTIMAHEVTHGFDNNGKNYDELGWLTYWWSSSSAAAHKARVDCIIQQYSEMNSEIRDYGYQVTGDAVADNGAMKVAYQLFKSTFGNDYMQRVDLPGLSLSNEQVFFISAAQAFCYSWDEVARKWLLMPDEHPFPPYRVNGNMQNWEAWANAFNCPVGSPMNPADRTRCSLWD